MIVSVTVKPAAAEYRQEPTDPEEWKILVVEKPAFQVSAEDSYLRQLLIIFDG